jgi:hypothetical protein
LKRHKQMMKPNVDRMIPQWCIAAASLKVLDDAPAEVVLRVSSEASLPRPH